jgi:hypothetical protein
MTDVLVDSNIILDVLTEDTQWFEWSSQKLSDYADQGILVINPFTRDINRYRTYFPAVQPITP